MCWGSKSSKPSASETGTCPPGSTAPCPLQCQCGSTQWLDTEVYCGDNARLKADLTGSCVDGPATIEILHPSNGSVVETINATLNGGHVEAVWVAKSQSANWRTDEIRFRVNAAGVTCTSSNVLKFRQRSTTAWELKNVTHSSAGGFAPSHEKHDVRLESDRVHFSLKLRTHGDPFDATKQGAAKTLIEDIWNNGFSGKKFHRTACRRGRTCDCAFDCCKAGFRLDVNFVASGEHLAVQVFATAPGTPTHRSGMNGDGGQWGDPAMTPATTYAHETGHVLGQHDEYPSGATDPTSPPAQPANATTPNLMSQPGNTTLLNRHYRYALAYLNSKADGDTYETIPPGE